jgi:hypothetical protein
MRSAAANAVFLSYASQEAEAARRICEALRTAGVEVWFSRLPRAVWSFVFRVLGWPALRARF